MLTRQFMDDKYSLKIINGKISIMQRETGDCIFSSYSFLIPDMKEEEKISRELCTPEFIDWLISKSYNNKLVFAIPKEMMTEKQCRNAYENLNINDRPTFVDKGYMDGIISNFDIDLLVKNDKHFSEDINSSVLTPRFIDMLIDKTNNWEDLSSIPKDTFTPEQLKKVYRKSDFYDKYLFIYRGYMDGLITSDILEELIDSNRLDCSKWQDISNKINKNLWNQELIDRIINNEDATGVLFAIPKEMFTVDQLKNAYNKLPIYYKADFICEGYMDGLITSDILEELLQNIDNLRNKKVFCFIPKELFTSEQCKKIYKNLDIENKCLFIDKGYMSGVITSDIFNELLDTYYSLLYNYDDVLSFDDSNVFKYDKKRILDRNFDKILKKIDKEIYDKKTAEKLLSIEKCKYIGFIPEEYLDYDTCKRAIELDWHNIAGVPIKYQNIELQKLVLNQCYKAISLIPEEAMSDEIMKYALNLNADVLKEIPEDKRTEEYCIIAFEKDPLLFRYIPNKYKSYSLCIKVLLEYPSLITEVPVHIINNEFLNIITSLLHIPISKEAMEYVNKCIYVNSKRDKIINLENKQNIQPVQIQEVISSLSINSLSSYFSLEALNYLRDNNIKTFGQLCNLANHPERILEYKIMNIRQEIVGTTKLLRCKYLNEDPLININDENTNVDEIIDILGLSYHAERGLLRANVCEGSVKDFFVQVGTKSFEKALHSRANAHIKNFPIDEIILKLNIIKEYYVNANKNLSRTYNEHIDNNNINSSENLESLKSKLHKLDEENKKLDAQTDIVLKKIQENNAIKFKGGSRK